MRILAIVIMNFAKVKLRHILLPSNIIGNLHKLANSMYKLCFYVPEAHLEPVKAALFALGAGHYHAYDHCCWQVRGEGQFKPLANSRAYLGKINQLERVAEYKVEMICNGATIKEVVQTLLSVHPYEEPAYEIYKILTVDDL